MFKNVKKAKIRPSDLAWLLGVSRPTCSMWMNGRAQPHALHVKKVQTLISAIDMALAANKLPVPPSKGDARKAHLRDALAPFLPKRVQ